MGFGFVVDISGLLQRVGAVQHAWHPVTELSLGSGAALVVDRRVIAPLNCIPTHPYMRLAGELSRVQWPHRF